MNVSVETNGPQSGPYPMPPPSLSVRILTPQGRGAVATIRIEGDWQRICETPALFHPANAALWPAPPLQRLVYGRWGVAEQPGEEIVVCRTSDDQFEMHCHGGLSATQRIVQDLQSRGAVVEAAWPEQCSSAADFLAEFDRALAETVTRRTALLVLQQSQRWAARLGVAHQRMSDSRASAAATSPSPLVGEGRGEGGERQQLLMHQPLTDSSSEQLPPEQIRTALSWAEFGRHLVQPWRVVLTGRPNVGKSSLLNALLGYSRAVVFDQPGTTRDVVTAQTALSGWPLEFLDTAGLRETAGTLEAAGIERARHALATADLVLLLIDQSQPAREDDHALLAEWPAAIVVAHKCDLPRQWGELPPGSLSVSSRTADGLDLLANAIVQRLIPMEPPADALYPVSESQAAWLQGQQDDGSPRK